MLASSSLISLRVIIENALSPMHKMWERKKKKGGRGWSKKLLWLGKRDRFGGVVKREKVKSLRNIGEDFKMSKKFNRKPLKIMDN